MTARRPLLSVGLLVPLSQYEVTFVAFAARFDRLEDDAAQGGPLQAIVGASLAPAAELEWAGDRGRRRAGDGRRPGHHPHV